MFNIYHDVEIKAEASEIFKMITTKDGLNKWWTVNSSGAPKLNELYNFYFSDEYNWFARVEACETDKFIHYRMEEADDDWKVTTLLFKIMPQNENINILRFEHNGWQNINDHFRKTSFCWAHYLNTLKNCLEN